MSTYLFDTEVLIDAARGVPEAIVCLAHYEQKGQLAISALTQMELIVGCRDNNELRKLNSFLQRFEVVRLNNAITDLAVSLVEQYWLSHHLEPPDALIAATALETNLPFFSKNQKDYRFIPQLDLRLYPP